MRFDSVEFWAFFAVVLLLHRVLPARRLLLVLASYAFYASWNPPFVLLLLFSSMLDFAIGHRLGALPAMDAGARTQRRALLGLSLLGNLGVLFYFKYVGFVLDNLVDAVDSALEITERLAVADPAVALHGAVALGPTVTIAGDVFGNTVNLAKRLTDVARKGKVIMPKDQAELLADRDDFEIHRVGRSFELKGVGRTSAVSVTRAAAPG